MKDIASERRTLLKAVVASGIAFASPLTRSEAVYPNRPIRFVFSLPPGGSGDAIARLISDGLSRALGVSVFVDNRPGGNGIIAVNNVMQAPADGYTYLLTSTNMVLTPLLRKSDYDPYKDFVPVSECARQPLVFSVHSKVGASTLADFIRNAKANPGKYSLGSFGVGSVAHLYGELLQEASGIELLHVPFKGESEAMRALVGGEIDSVFFGPSAVKPQADKGVLHMLAVVGKERLSVIPEVMTFPQAGYPSINLVGMHGLYARAGTPSAFVQRIMAEVGKVIATPEVSGRIRDLGAIPVGGTGEQLLGEMKKHTQRWSVLIKQKNIHLE
jgi:tripartite-type tricarboxylate transporter receptor subunit TctC